MSDDEMDDLMYEEVPDEDEEMVADSFFFCF